MVALAPLVTCSMPPSRHDSLPLTDVVAWIARLPLPVARGVLRTAVRVGENEAIALLMGVLPAAPTGGLGDANLRERLIDAVAHRVSPEPDPDDDPDSQPTEILTMVLAGW